MNCTVCGGGTGIVGGICIVSGVGVKYDTSGIE